MTPAVLWMRHGTCDDGLRRPRAHARPDSRLTIAGTVEAQLTAGQLRAHRWRPALVASSPLRRAHHTATIVADVLHTGLTEPAAVFTEWRAPHAVLGLTPSQYPPDYLVWREQRTRNPDSALPGGESLRAFAERATLAASTARDLVAENGPMLIVSHRLLIGAVAALHDGVQHPAEVFRYASDFPLKPARLWTTP
jgi:broad specificity phosphatase PhoE